MQKGETAISVALVGVLVLAFMVIQRRWQQQKVKESASTDEELLLTAPPPRGQIPEIPGYEKVRTFPLGGYQAGLYRASPAPLVFAPGRLVIYDQNNKPVFKLETLEGSREPWTTLYDFAGRNGLPVPRGRARPVYVRALTGTGDPDIVIGQYSGGGHCCTTATVVELGKDSFKVVGRIEGLDGLPFEGLEIVKLDQDPAWEIVAHRPYRTRCGTHQDAADVVAVFDYGDGQYSNQTARHGEFLQSHLRRSLQQWSKEKDRSIRLLSTLATSYALLGQREQAKRFFAMNLMSLAPELRKQGADPNPCIEDMETLLDRLASAGP